MINTLLIKLLMLSGSLADVSRAMDDPASGLELYRIDRINWPADYPYAPEVSFRAAHDGDTLFLKFYVHEECTMARVAEDNGEVWTDSCVEFFISFDDTGYYNLELSCIGKALLGFRKQKDDCVHGSPEVMQSIGRYPSLGTEPFAERKGDNLWELTVAVPRSAFFKHGLHSLRGTEARGNVYKCGDNLSQPHFLSWNPIQTPTPNFHVEEYFGKIVFE